MLCVQIYAFDRSFEGAIAACGAPLVGILAERLFGFKACCCISPALHLQSLHSWVCGARLSLG